MNNVARVPLA